MEKNIDYSRPTLDMANIRSLNSRVYARKFEERGESLFTSEQSKVMWFLWHNDCMTTTDLSIATGLAKNTLSVMLERLERNGLVETEDCSQDKRKKFYKVTELGASQRKLGEEISAAVGEIFYQGFTDSERDQFERYLKRIVENLRKADND
ncbi:MarR family winged helix-turn-helix transcriptional regulator [Alloscardovia theropitheci]|nr:MarR family transcriptional regulator [Alloscardovia theropitheci]